KGRRQFSWERGFWEDEMFAKGAQGQKHIPALGLNLVLGQYPGLLNVTPSLEALVEQLVGFRLVQRKYTCELNPVELVWGRSKQE
ncbi:unnamed protein product, partial [Scytosiphon promiscuus]